MVLLWLDDIRDPFDGDWLVFSPIERPFDVVWVKNYNEFTNWIETNGLPDGICFDHDLSDIHISKSTYKEKTGYDCAKWLVDYCIDNNKTLPKFNVQSANPVGKQNIISLLDNFNKHTNEKQ